VFVQAGKFRRLVGTMSPIDETSNVAEIYVEGSRKMVDGFVRWCEKSSKKVGMSQVISVIDVMEEDVTGLYEDFYAQTSKDESPSTSSKGGPGVP
jgi:hypothetical protein